MPKKKTKFLLDADMPRSSASTLRDLGYDVEDVRDTDLRGATDRAVIEYALQTKRIVVTRDTDFGQVIRYPTHPGAIIIRLPNTFNSKQINERLTSFMTHIVESDLKNAIVIVQLSRYRIRRIE